MNKYYRDSIAIIANLIWFLVWLYIVFVLDNSGWWLLVPASIHWRDDQKNKG